MARAVVGHDVGRRSITTVERKRPVEAIVIDAIWLIVGIVLVLLALRFVLLLLGANPDAGFTQFIYAVTAPLMVPFTAVFGETVLDQSVFDWSTLLAMAVYALIGWLLTALVAALTPRASYEAVETESAASADESRVVAQEPTETVVRKDDTAVGPDDDTVVLPDGRVVRREDHMP